MFPEITPSDRTSTHVRSHSGVFPMNAKKLLVAAILAIAIGALVAGSLGDTAMPQPTTSPGVRVPFLHGFFSGQSATLKIPANAQNGEFVPLPDVGPLPIGRCEPRANPQRGHWRVRSPLSQRRSSTISAVSPECSALCVNCQSGPRVARRPCSRTRRAGTAAQMRIREAARRD